MALLASTFSAAPELPAALVFSGAAGQGWDRAQRPGWEAEQPHGDAFRSGLWGRAPARALQAPQALPPPGPISAPFLGAAPGRGAAAGPLRHGAAPGETRCPTAATRPRGPSCPLRPRPIRALASPIVPGGFVVPPRRAEAGARAAGKRAGRRSEVPGPPLPPPRTASFYSDAARRSQPAAGSQPVAVTPAAEAEGRAASWAAPLQVGTGRGLRGAALGGRRGTGRGAVLRGGLCARVRRSPGVVGRRAFRRGECRAAARPRRGARVRDGQSAGLSPRRPRVGRDKLRPGSPTVPRR